MEQVGGSYDVQSVYCNSLSSRPSIAKPVTQAAKPADVAELSRSG